MRKNINRGLTGILGAGTMALSGCTSFVSGVGHGMGEEIGKGLWKGGNSTSSSDRQAGVSSNQAQGQQDSLKFCEGKTETGWYYRGQILASTNEFHGKGLLISPDGNLQYDGDFRNGLFHGEGTATYRLTDTFGKQIRTTERGQWKDGKRHGRREVSGDLGSSFIMNHNEDEYLGGEGIVILSNGEKYIGEWFLPKGDGKGKIIYLDGREYNGEWRDPKPEDNDFRDFPHGNGTMKWSDGREYNGEWKLGTMHGFGILTLQNGIKKEGFFRDDEFIGKLVKESEKKLEDK